MRIIISPAKKMRSDTDSFSCRRLPQFLPQTEILLERLQGMSDQELKTLWKCNEQIVKVNIERIRHMDLQAGLTPALMAYEGIQYRYMAPNVFTNSELDYVEEHLRILSGFYGILRPFDGVTPYRLELGAQLAIGNHKNLYDFWGDRLAKTLFEEGEWVLNLASLEYSRSVSTYVPKDYLFLTCVFGERKGEKIVEKGTLCKMARGEMVRWLAQEEITAPEDIKNFTGLGYRYAPDVSNKEMFVFVKENETQNLRK